MKFAAFFRNLNLGHPTSPDRPTFERAFREAGATSADSFQTNGTLVFEAADVAAGHAVYTGAQQGLSEACGLREPIFVRTLAYLQALVDSRPFDGIDPATVYGCFVSFLHAPDSPRPPAKARRADGGVELIVASPGELLCVSRMVGKQPGSPNAYFERLLGAPLTTRSWGTVTRLVAKHG